MEPRNRFQGINSASLCSLAGRYDNPIPTRCITPIDYLKIPARCRCTLCNANLIELLDDEAELPQHVVQVLIHLAHPREQGVDFLITTTVLIKYKNISLWMMRRKGIHWQRNKLL